MTDNAHENDQKPDFLDTLTFSFQQEKNSKMDTLHQNTGGWGFRTHCGDLTIYNFLYFIVFHDPPVKRLNVSKIQFNRRESKKPMCPHSENTRRGF